MGSPGHVLGSLRTGGSAGRRPGVLRQIPASRLARRTARLGLEPWPAAGLAAVDPGRPGVARVADRRKTAVVVPGVRRHRQHGDRRRVSRGPTGGAGPRHPVASPGRHGEPQAVPDELLASLPDQTAEQPADATGGRSTVSCREFPVRRQHHEPIAQAGAEARWGRRAGRETHRGAIDDQGPGDGFGGGPERYGTTVRGGQSGSGGHVQRFCSEFRSGAHRWSGRSRRFAGRETGRPDLCRGGWERPKRWTWRSICKPTRK